MRIRARIVNRSFIPLLVAGMFCSPWPGLAQPTPRVKAHTPLPPGANIRREVLGGDTVEYRLDLVAGDVVRISAEQIGADVALHLAGPNARALAKRDAIDGPQVGLERLTHLVAATGTYRLSVLSLRGKGSRGAYILSLETPRAATREDTLWVKADDALALATEALGESQDSLLRASSLAAVAVSAARDAQAAALEAEALLLLGDTYVELRKGDSAKTALMDAIGVLEASNDRRGLIRAYHKLSVAAFNSNDGEGATTYLRRALSYARQTRIPLVESNIASELSYVLTLRGKLDSALVLIDSARSLARQVNDGEQLTHTLVNYARVLQRTGDYEKQVETNRELARVAKSTDDRLSEGIAENNLGVTFNDLAQYREAITHYERALVLLTALKEPRGRARIHANIAVILARTAPDSALRRFDRAIAIQDSIGDLTGKTAALTNVGQVYIERKRDFARAAKYLDSAFRLVRPDADPRTASIVLGHLAKALQRLGMRDSSEALLRSSLVYSGKAGDIRTQAVTYQVLAAHWDRRGVLDSSRVLLERGLRLWETIWRKAQTGGTQTALLEQFADNYAFYNNVLLRLQVSAPDSLYAERTLQLAESSRSRVLQESLHDIRLRLSRGVDSATTATIRTLQSEIDRAATAYSRSPTNATERAVDSLLAAYDALTSATRRENLLIDRTSAPPTLTIAELRQRVLDPESVLLEYQLGDGRSHLWVATTDTVVAFLLPPRDSLTRMITALHASVSARTRHVAGESAVRWRSRIGDADRAYTRGSEALSQALLAPARAFMRGKRLIIVPAGALYLVPFGALPDPDVAAPAAAPLIVGHEIVYLPSASTAVLLRDRLRPASRDRELMVIADPVFSSDDGRVAVNGRVATVSRPQGGAMARDTTAFVRSLRGTDVSAGDALFARLPSARREAEAIVRLVGANKARAAYDFDASVKTVLDTAAGTYRVVHFATHAIFNTDKPELSGVLLAQVDKSGLPVDGYLRLHHIYSLDWSSELVVLSACETAIGRKLDGEGMISLARGFLQAGAARVVGTLWKVEDRESADFMAAFYRKMYVDQLRPAAALRQAQIDMYRSRATTSPYYWGAFTLTGDWK